VIRAKQMTQDKAQTVDNGMSLLRAVTPYWVICLAPFGRTGRRLWAVLRPLEMTRHSPRGVPRIKRLLSPKGAYSWWCTQPASHLAEHGHITFKGSGLWLWLSVLPSVKAHLSFAIILNTGAISGL
jgi:hypothetical protein